MENPVDKSRKVYLVWSDPEPYNPSCVPVLVRVFENKNDACVFAGYQPDREIEEWDVSGSVSPDMTKTEVYRQRGFRLYDF